MSDMERFKGEYFQDVVLDIETYPDVPPDLMKHMRTQVTPPKNYKDPEKIERYIEDEMARQIERAGLSPRTGRVLAVGLGLRKDDDEEWEYYVLVDKSNDERRLLGALDEMMHEAACRHIITFNGRKFDLPFLAARAMLHRMNLRHRWPLGYDKRHIDLFELLGKDGGLKVWATSIMGIEMMGTGKDVAGMVDDGRWIDLQKYCEQDVRATAALYDAFSLVAERR